MAVNASRSMGRELEEGMTDGSYRKVAPDRGGWVEPQTQRDTLNTVYYGTQPPPLPLPARHLPDARR